MLSALRQSISHSPTKSKQSADTVTSIKLT